MNAINFNQSYFRTELQSGETAKVHFCPICSQKIEARTTTLQDNYDPVSRMEAVEVAPQSN